MLLTLRHGLQEDSPAASSQRNAAETHAAQCLALLLGKTVVVEDGLAEGVTACTHVTGEPSLIHVIGTVTRTVPTNLGRASFVCETAEFRLDRGVDTKTLVMNSLVTPSSTHNKYEIHLCKTLVCPGLAQFEDVMR